MDPSIEDGGSWWEADIEFTIAVDGSVKDAKVIRSEPPTKAWEERALAQVRNGRRDPPVVNGMNVETVGRAIIRYKPA